MAGLKMNVGLGGSGGAAGYAGPVYSIPGGAADVPGSGGYGDTGRGGLTGLSFGPAGTSAGMASSPAAHATLFGIACFGLLLFMAWALPR
jgi:hypothetical protein